MSVMDYCSKPSKAVLAQLFAQSVYVVLSFYCSAHVRVLWHLALIYAICIGANLAWDRWVARSGKTVLLHFGILAMCNSMFVNLEIYSLAGLFAAASFTMVTRLLIVDRDGQYVFNAAMAGVLFVCMVLPATASPGGGGWGDFWPLSLVIPAVGGIACILAGTLPVVFAYMLGFTAIAATAQLGLIFMGVLPEWERAMVTPLYWPATLLSMGSLIFAFGVISDPKTCPRGWKAQVVFGVSVAALDYTLRTFKVMLPDLFAYLIVQGAWAFLRALRPAPMLAAQPARA